MDRKRAVAGVGGVAVSEDFTWHGGRLAQARAIFGDGPEPWIDLSTGINSRPWPGAAAIAPDWCNLPDPQGLVKLEEAAAAYFGADPDHVCAVPGSEMGLRLLGALFELPARHLTPAYRTHGAIFPVSRAVASLDAPPTEPTMLVLANPNNPDGRMLPRASLREWLDWEETAGGWMIVDEAFADVTPDISLAGDVDCEGRLIVMRSFGKFFGLAGVRLGFMIAPRRIVAALRHFLGDWPVSAAAIAIGTAAYHDLDWIASARKAIDLRARALDTLLMRHGLEAKGECPLFRLVECPDAHGLFERLARHRILTRPFEERSDWLRFGLPAGEAQLDRLDRALRDG